jgi:hypothetical protein
MPNRAAAHDHVPRRRANRTHERSHVIRPVDHHPLRGETIQGRGLQRGFWIVGFEVKRRLIVDKDEEDVRPARFRREDRGCEGAQRQERETAAHHE